MAWGALTLHGVDCALGLISSGHGHDKMYGAIMSGLHNHPGRENQPIVCFKRQFPSGCAGPQGM